MPYPRSPSTIFPFPPYTAAWRVLTPSQLAAANALTPSRVWTAWLPPSHTAPLPTVPPATVWTPSLQATSIASMARVSKPCINNIHCLIFFSWNCCIKKEFQKQLKGCSVPRQETLLNFVPWLVEADTCS